MTFSATGNLLPGSIQQPDITTIVTIRQFDTPWRSESDGKLHKLNIFGYIPGVSTITGIGRALLGVVHTIVHLVCAIFSKNRQRHLEEASLGAKNVVRGIVEAMPIIGNITMFIVDVIRTVKYSNMADNIISTNRSNYMDCVVTFAYGQEISKQPLNRI